MRRVLLVSVILAAVLPFVVGAHLQPADSKGFTLTNRLAPVGVATVEYSSTARPANVKPLRPQIVPSVNSGGCSPVSCAK